MDKNKKKHKKTYFGLCLWPHNQYMSISRHYLQKDNFLFFMHSRSAQF